jgi:hypothetical protein
LAGIGLTAAGPHFHKAIVPPPAVVPTKAVVPAASVNGLKEIELVVALVPPPRFVWFPKIVMMPLALTVPLVTILVALNVHTLGRMVDTSATVDVWTASVMEVRQEDAARTISEALLRTV